MLDATFILLFVGFALFVSALPQINADMNRKDGKQ